MAEHLDWDAMFAKVKLEDDAVGEIKPVLKPCPCPLCGVKLRKKITVRGETVFDHPKNGCKNEGYRCRSYKEAIEAWNRRSDGK